MLIMIGDVAYNPQHITKVAADGEGSSIFTTTSKYSDRCNMTVSQVAKKINDFESYYSYDGFGL